MKGKELTQEQITNAAKIMLMMRRKKYQRTIICEGCGKEVQAVHPSKRFCSKRCCMRVYMREYSKRKRLAGNNPTNPKGGDVQ